jgi:hypothetical protein
MLRRRARSIGLLLGLILLAVITSGIMYTRSVFGPPDWIEGTLGVMLGLFICSRPAAHLLDLLYQPHYSGPPKLWIWLTLNLLTLLVGVIVVFLGVMHFTRATVRHSDFWQ